MKTVTTCDTSNVPSTWTENDGRTALTVTTLYYMGMHMFIELAKTVFDCEGNLVEPPS